MTPFDPIRDTPADETDWLAVRYVLGELPEDEAAAFESRLADNQSAREAVVRATRLVETLAAVPWAKSDLVPPFRVGFRRIAAALAATAAAVIVGLIAYQSDMGEVPDNEPQIAADDVDPARLVVLWSASSETLNGVAEVEPSEDLSSADADSALLPPDWMLAAVEQEARLSPIDPSLDAEFDAIERN